MEFNDDNLTKEDIRKSLEFMKQGIEFYKSEYAGRTYIYDLNYEQILIKIPDFTVPHLLGYDLNGEGTWLEYIGSKRVKINSLEWLEEFVKSVEFIEYMVFKRKEPKLVNFSKIMFKSQHFCNMSLEKNSAFLFDSKIGRNMIRHIGIFGNEELTTIRLIKSKKQSQLLYTPRSLYVYDNDFKYIRLKIPQKLTISERNKTIYPNGLYSSDSIEELKQKIKNFR